MASVVGICNLALRLLGARRITALTDSTEEARACNDVYETLRDSLLRAHPWNFATVRASLAASTTAPAWGYEKSYPLPSDCLRVLSVDTTYQWEVEGRNIVTDEGAPLYMKYTSKEEDPNQFDSNFIKALAAYIALELAERLTQSNTKRQLAQNSFDLAMRNAKFTDAQESTPKTLEDGSWLDSRNYTSGSKESWEY